MATEGERLATVEAEVKGAAQGVNQILDALNGGGAIAWERSIRGRLHTIENELAAARWVRQASQRSFSRNEKAIAMILAISAAIGPWVALLVGAHK